MTPPAEHEGIIKFHLEFSLAPPLALEQVAELNAWRRIFFQLGLTGRDPARYAGLAYGNVSQRTEGRSFIVSGTQTGDKPNLNPADYCLVIDFDLEKNRLSANGPIEPSSEALTHGAIYSAAPQTACVIHVHSPEIWRNARRLGIPITDESIAYGTPAMGRAVIAAATRTSGGIIAMGGHQDGVLAFADEVGLAAIRLLQCLVIANKLEHCAVEVAKNQATG